MEHRRGRLHNNANALSRRPCRVDCKHCHRAEQKKRVEFFPCKRTLIQPSENWSAEALCLDQLTDSDLKPIMEYKAIGNRPEWKDISAESQNLKCYWAPWDSLTLIDKTLQRTWKSADGKEIKLQILVPASRRREVLAEIHGGTSGGHFGVTKT